MTLSMILIGILPSVFFGVATTLMGKTGGSDRQRVMGAVLGGLLMAAVATPFLHPAWTPLNLGVSFLTGLLLGVGVCDQLRSYSVLGMSRTMPLSTGGQLVLMSLAGIAIFGEWLHGGALPYGLAAIAVLILWLHLTSRVVLLVAAWMANPPLPRDVGHPDEVHAHERLNYVTLSVPETLAWPRQSITGSLEADPTAHPDYVPPVPIP